jgi:FixJ family two-component response regulator
VSKAHVIAVIDDDETFRAALIDLLSSLGYDTEGYPSAESFFAARGEKACDCIITDIHMPGMSGLDLQRVLIEHESKVPLIMITARMEPGLDVRALGSGAACFLRKPFRSDALIACLKEVFAAQ